MVHTEQSPQPYYVSALALGLPAFLFGVEISGWIGFVPLIRQGYVDFRHLYAAGYMVRSGHAQQLYSYRAQEFFQNTLVSPSPIATPFIRPAHEAILFAPLSFLTYRTAYVVFLLVNLALAGLCVWLLRDRMASLRTIFSWLPSVMLLTFTPVAVALMQGQDSILLLVLLSAAVFLLDRRRDFAAGTLVGLSTFKPQLAVPIAILFLLWRKWRFIGGYALSALTAAIASLVLVGPARLSSYADHLFHTNTEIPITGGRLSFPVPINQMANLHGLIWGLTGAYVSTSAIHTIALLVSAIVLLSVGIGARHIRHGSDALIIAILTSILVSYYMLLHDLSVAFVPIVLVLDRYLKAKSIERSSASLTCMAALLFVAPVSMSFFPGYFYLVSLIIGMFLILLLRRVTQGNGLSNFPLLLSRR